jgi:hypothetical protein
MYNPYGFHSMSKLYREEALRDARTHHLEGRLRAERRQVDPGQSRAALAWGGLVSLLRSATLAGQTAERNEEQ